MTTLTLRPTTTFQVPTTAFADAPAERRGVPRDEVRLLVAGPGGVRHSRFADLPDHLRPGDLVVVNNSATVPGQLDATWERGESSVPVVLHVGSRLDDLTRVVELRTAPDAGRAVLDAEPGEVVRVGGATATLVAPYPEADSSPTGSGNRLWRARVEGDLAGLLRRQGRPISYGYLSDHFPLSAYQSVFSTESGSAEMPSAGRPFTHEVITRLVANGVGVAPITLHTGFSSQEAGEAPQPEWFAVPAATARLATSTRAAGGRVVAVGTTVTRALESAVDGDRVVARHGWTERVVTPADPPQVVDGLVTGWHDPGASHLLLVEAVAGPALTQVAYDAATAEGYLWHEFGDAALLLRR
ncbi:S-adenosylmethionine:tRNA ribosyltransferase-isomerase [Nocardioides sp.]|uniref:S-adenosylmethionine:tRNA ribosyltransferase-isomerase n=1 Tax=Nocardioides sp. TaxID=35761 RepID=UPI002ED370F0